MTPEETVRTYLDAVWNNRRLDQIGVLISDPTTRHYPGVTKTLSRAESVGRVGSFHRGHPDTQFEIALLLSAGELVTLAWTGRLTPTDGEPYEQAGIEIFRVRDSEIVEVWNAKEAAGRWTSAPRVAAEAGAS
jgi:predicted SnoaL-like aldol condensation-catalyzing enzyme